MINASNTINSNPSPKPKKFRAAVFAEEKLVKIVGANSEEAREHLIAEYTALGYSVKKGFIRIHKEKLVWMEEGIRSRLIATHGVPIENIIID